MTFEIKQATRTAVKPMICLYSESGCGKTYSALLVARGFVGPSGKMVLADTESGRGSLYADVIPGGYSVIDIKPPFSPLRAIEVMQAVHVSGAAIGILDSGSHFWEGIGGVLEMATENESKSGKTGLHNWRLPKLEHAKFVLALLQAPIPWIVCLRAKYKTRQAKENGRTVIIKDDYTSPIQAEDFMFEATLHGEIMPDHSFRLTKQSHPALGACFPNNAPITIEHGQKLAAWCAAAGKPTRFNDSASFDKQLATELWAILKSVRGPEKNWNEANKWLWREEILDGAVPEEAPNLSADRFRQVIALAKETLSGVTA